MLYRIKDFEQVYNIAEHKFRHKDDDFQIKKSVEEVVEIAQHDLKKKNIDLQVNVAQDMPVSARADSMKFK